VTRGAVHTTGTNGGLLLAAIAALALAVRAPTLGLALVALAGAAALALRWPALPLALWQGASIVGLLLGGHLPRGATSLGFAAWVGAATAVMLLRRDRERPPLALFADATAIAGLVLTALLVLRLSVSPDQTYGSQKVQLFLTTCALPFAAAAVIGASRRMTDVFLRGYVAVGVGTAVYDVLAILGGSAASVNAGRYTADASIDPIELGRQMAAVLVVLVAATASARTARRRLLYAALMLPAAVALLGSGSRGPLLGLVASLLVLTLTRLHDPLVLRRLLVTLAVGTVVGGGAVVALVPPQTVGRALSAFAGADTSGESTTRAQLWDEALHALPNDPLTLAFGRGTGAFAHLDPSYSYPHNVPIELLYELGLVGLAAFVLAVVTAVVRVAGVALRRGPTSRVAGLAAALLVGALVNSQFTGDLAGNTDIWLFGGLASGLVARHRVALHAALAARRTSSSSLRRLAS
jgi:O-antigen ligase